MGRSCSTLSPPDYPKFAPDFLSVSPDYPTSAPALVSVSPEQDSGGRHRHDPDRGHRDHEGPDGVAVRVRDAVESLEDGDGAVEQEQKGDADACPAIFQFISDGMVKRAAAYCPRHGCLVRFPHAQLHVSRRSRRRTLRPRRRAGAGGRGRGLRPRHRDGPLLSDPRRRSGDRTDARGVHDAGRAGGAARRGSSSARWSPASPIATRRSSPSRSRRSTSSPRAAPSSASAPPGTRTSTSATASSFRPSARRMDRLDEALTIARLMFTEERPSFEGKYYRIDRALNVPAAHPARGSEDPDRRRRREAHAAHPRPARRHRPLVRRSDRRAEAQEGSLRGALRRGRARPVRGAADDWRRPRPGRERERRRSRSSTGFRRSGAADDPGR